MSEKEKRESLEVLNDVMLKLSIVENLLLLYDTEKPIFDGNEDPEEVRYFMNNYRICLEASLEAALGARKIVETLYKEGVTA